MTKVAAALHLSSSFLARVCAALNVPRPERGHWAKVAIGRTPQRAPRLGLYLALFFPALLGGLSRHASNVARSPGSGKEHETRRPPTRSHTPWAFHLAR